MTNFYWKLESELPEVFETGAGNAVVIKGYGFYLTGATKRVTVRLGEQVQQDLAIHEPRHDVFLTYATLDTKGFSQTSGFWGILSIPWILGGLTLDLVLEAEHENGDIFKTVVGSIKIVNKLSLKKVDVDLPVNNLPFVAICMATYNPEIEPFQRQIKSIINQSYNNWICIINDDGSTKERYAAIKKICGSDRRFYLFQNKANVGFYRNFEMALRRVPDTVEYVAMADQDDFWYPDKIKSCLDLFGPETQLVYSDMRIVTDDGNILSETYWVNRKNNFKDMDVILLANTVTGAASVFRRCLLEKVVPFPERIGDAFHDNWIALTALMAGEIEYVDRPLYDYIQYSGHVIGHCDFDSLTVKGRFMRLRAYMSIYTRVLGKKLISTRRDGKTVKRNVILIKDYFFTEARKIYQLLQAVYTNEYRRLQIFSAILNSRFSDTTAYKKKVLNIFNSRPSTISGLLQAHIDITRHRHTTNDAEIRLLVSYMAHTFSKRMAGWMRTRNVKRNFRQVRNSELEMQHATQFLAQKIAPLKIKANPLSPRRINILIPTIDLHLLFGGYIGKLNLAKRFIDCGYNVRIVIVDECDFLPVKANGTLSSASPLASYFNKIEFQYCFDRESVVIMHPDDIVIASTWWTAHIAHAAVKNLSHKQFIYFIQEYEPFTFSMGSYSALAKQSYQFPHYPLFSSKLLKEYFEINQLSVFGNPDMEIRSRSAVFENAIASFVIDRGLLENRKFKRVLFYSRPEPHASRNMFEIGVLALKKAIDDGVFDDHWEFWGAGTAYGEIPLSKNRVLKLIGKLDLDAYQKTLPEFDLGVSLMYTPHPSLVPIEMAAAGMVVITTNCLNKTAEKMAAISSNIIGVEASVEAIVEGLAHGVEKSSDIEERLKGANVKWPKSWEESLPRQLIHKMVRWFDE